MNSRLTMLAVITGVALIGLTQAQPSRISIATGGTAGTYFPLGGAMADLINEHIPGVQANAEVTGASIENVRLVADGRAEIALANANAPFYARKGTEPFNKSHEKIVAIAAHHPSVMQIAVPAGSNITTIGDLAGKRVNVGAPGGANAVMTEAILKGHGLTTADVKAQRLTFAEVVNAFHNDRLDAAFILSGFPMSALIDLSSSMDIRLLPLEEDALANINEEHPYYTAFTLPGSTYDGIESDIPSLSVWNVIFTNAVLDEGFIYDVTKLFYENLDRFESAHPISRFMTLENAVNVSIPLHPGAARYFEEQGVLDVDD